MSEKFQKKDLKNGDVVVTRNNTKYITWTEFGTFVGEKGFLSITEGFDDDFNNKVYPAWDIIKVYRPEKPHQCSFYDPCFNTGKLMFCRVVDEMKGVENI